MLGPIAEASVKITVDDAGLLLRIKSLEKSIDSSLGKLGKQSGQTFGTSLTTGSRAGLSNVEKDAAKAAALAEKQAAKATALAEKQAAKIAALGQREAAKAAALAQKEAAKAAALGEKQAAKATALAEKQAAKATALAEKQAAKTAALAEKSTAQTAARAEKQAAATSARIGSILKGAAVIGAGSVAIVGAAAVKGVKDFTDFQAGMNEVFSLIPQAGKATFDKMTVQVQDFSRKFAVLPDKVIPALYQSLSAGVPAGNVFDFLTVAQQAARGGVTTLETAVDGLTSVVNTFGASQVSAQQASDLMFTAVKLGKTTMDELSKSLFNVDPIASSIGVTFHDVTASIAAMSSLGVPTSVATTQLRQALVELGSSTQIAGKNFQAISGKSFPDFIKGGGTLQQALQLMEKGAADSGKSINQLFGSVEAGQAALSLTGKGTTVFTGSVESRRPCRGGDENGLRPDGARRPVFVRRFEDERQTGVDFDRSGVRPGRRRNPEISVRRVGRCDTDDHEGVETARQNRRRRVPNVGAGPRQTDRRGRPRHSRDRRRCPAGGRCSRRHARQPRQHDPSRDREAARHPVQNARPDLQSGTADHRKDRRGVRSVRADPRQNRRRSRPRVPRRPRSRLPVRAGVSRRVHRSGTDDQRHRRDHRRRVSESVRNPRPGHQTGGRHHGRRVEKEMPILAKAMIDVAKAIAPILPVLAELIGQLVKALLPFLPLLIDGFVNMVKMTAALDQVLVPLLVPLLKLVTLLVDYGLAPILTVIAFEMGLWTKAVQTLLGWLITGVGAIASFVSSMDGLKKLGGLIVAAWDKVVTFFTDLPGKIVSGLASLPGAILGAFTGAFTWVHDHLGDAAQAVFDWFTNLAGRLAGVLSTLGSQILGAFGSAFTWVHDGLEVAAKAVFDWFKDLPGKIIGILGDKDLGLPAMLAAFGGAFTVVADGLTVAAQAVFDWFTNLPGNLVTVMGDVGTKLLDAFKIAFGFVGDHLTEAASGIFDWFSGFGGALAASFALGPLGPLLLLAFSQIFTRLIPSIPGLFSKVADAFTIGVGQVASAVSDAAVGIVTTFSHLPALIGAALSELGPSLQSAFISAAHFLVTALPKAFKAVGDFFVDLPGRLGAALPDIGTVLISAATGGFLEFGGFIKDSIQKVVDTFGGLPGSAASAAATIGPAVTNAVIGGVGAFETWLAGRVQAAVGFFATLPQRAAQAAINLGPAVVSAITGGMVGFTLFVTNVINKIVGFFLSLPGHAAAAAVNLGPRIISAIAGGMNRLLLTSPV